METLRNKLIRVVVVALLLAVPIPGLCWHFATAQEKESQDKGSGGMEVATRFAGTLRLINAKGAIVPLHVELREWHVTRSARGVEFPEQGFYIAHLLSGVIATEIAGKSVSHSPGDFWTVERGIRMVVRMNAHREAAVIQTIQVGPAY